MAKYLHGILAKWKSGKMATCQNAMSKCHGKMPWQNNMAKLHGKKANGQSGKRANYYIKWYSTL